MILNNNAFEHLNERQIFELMYKICDGSFEMSKQQFRNALKRSIGADKGYADGCWIDFQDAPMHYICSRNPRTQGYELIRVCLNLAKNRE